MTDKTNRHVHAELIHKWAEGATIQVKNDRDQWVDCLTPQWFDSVEYRVKPKVMRRVVVARMECPAASSFTITDGALDHAFMFHNREQYPVTVEVSRVVDE